MIDDSISCDTCCYWQQLDDGETGECRLHAPRPRTTNSNDTRWPITTDTDWCGEWDCDDDSDDTDDLVDAEFEDIIERLTVEPKRRWWARKGQ